MVKVTLSDSDVQFYRAAAIAAVEDATKLITSGETDVAKVLQNVDTLNEARARVGRITPSDSGTASTPSTGARRGRKPMTAEEKQAAAADRAAIKARLAATAPPAPSV